MQLIRFSSGAVLEMKKTHPCGSRLFSVLRGGSDVRIKCNGCGKDMTLPREKLEKMIKKVVSQETAET
ncbi:MAG: DUF951 domain-containing protein [Clostridia bacterium]|nr:DUF951 domain-containing protein [Clostridia bacterium]